MDIFFGILLLKSASLHFVLLVIVLIAIKKKLINFSIVQVMQTPAENVQHIFSFGNKSIGKSHK
jgi:hypothetical protein